MQTQKLRTVGNPPDLLKRIRARGTYSFVDGNKRFTPSWWTSCLYGGGKTTWHHTRYGLICLFLVRSNLFIFSAL